MTNAEPTRRRFLRAVGATAVGSAAGCASPTPERDLEARPDAIFRGGLRRHGYHDGTIPGDVERAWRIPNVNTGDHTAAKASPLPAPTGDLIVPGDAGVVHAVTPDGEIRWRASTAPSIRGIHGTPAIANGTAYVGAYDGALYAFDLETGVRRWRTGLGDAIGSSPAYHDGTLYVSVEFYAPSGSLLAVDAATGEVVAEDGWPTDHPHSTPAIDLDAGRLVFGSNDGFLYAWEYPSLERAWRFETGGAIKGPVATYDGAAFFGSWDGNVYRVDLEDGALDWRFAADDMVMTGPGIAADAGTVYMGSHDTNLYAIDARTGEERWSFGTGGWLIGCPMVTRGSVLVGSYDRHLYAVDAASGDERWRAPATGWVTSTPLVHEGSIYYTDRASEAASGGAYRLDPVGGG